MTELELAIERLERAVTRLEAARQVAGAGGESDGTQIKEIAERVDRALTQIARVLGEEGIRWDKSA
jgi:adenylate cyclase associated (CAP) protein